MNTQAMQPGSHQESSILEASPTPASPSSPITIEPKPTAKVSVEIPAGSGFNPFDPAWIKLWEEVGPLSYLALLCLFVYLLTRLVETVRGK